MGPFHRGSLILSRLNGLRMPSGDSPAPLLESPDSQIGHGLVLYQAFRYSGFALNLLTRFYFILSYFLSFICFVPIPSILLFSLSLFSLPLTLTGSPVSIVALFSRDGSSDIRLSS